MRFAAGKSLHERLCALGFHVETRPRTMDGKRTKSCIVCKRAWLMIGGKWLRKSEPKVAPVSDREMVSDRDLSLKGEAMAKPKTWPAHLDPCDERVAVPIHGA